jgi:uncharacterized protein (DUF1499 family)
MFILKGLLLVLVVALAGLNAYVRLARVDPAHWHIDLSQRPAPMGPQSFDKVTAFANGAYVDLTKASLDQLNAVALSTPRTHLIAGSVEEGRITWETRSLLWGFPDYTTAQVSGEGLILLARSRYGSGDWGVNGKRLTAWIASL